MQSKFKKTLPITCMIVIIGVLACGFVYASSNTKLSETRFTGANNSEITVFNYEQDNSYETLPIDTDLVPEIGQVIDCNGEKEVVFAIGPNGSYITMPADY